MSIKKLLWHASFEDKLDNSSSNNQMSYVYFISMTYIF